MSDFKKIGIPFLVIVLGAFITKLMQIYLSNIVDANMMKVVLVIVLCLFGAMLNTSSKRRNGYVWKKVVAILVVLFLLFMQLNLFAFDAVNEFFAILGIGSFFINLLYILSGYLFVD